MSLLEEVTEELGMRLFMLEEEEEAGVSEVGRGVSLLVGVRVSLLEEEEEVGCLLYTSPSPRDS